MQGLDLLVTFGWAGNPGNAKSDSRVRRETKRSAHATMKTTTKQKKHRG
jgi:hypothetical protein